MYTARHLKSVCFQYLSNPYTCQVWQNAFHASLISALRLIFSPSHFFLLLAMLGSYPIQQFALFSLHSFHSVPDCFSCPFRSMARGLRENLWREKWHGEKTRIRWIGVEMVGFVKGQSGGGGITKTKTSLEFFVMNLNRGPHCVICYMLRPLFAHAYTHSSVCVCVCVRARARARL